MDIFRWLFKMDKRSKIMNHKSFDISLLSDSSSSDTQTNAVSDFDATEKCSLLLQMSEEKPAKRHRKRESKFRRQFCDDDDENRNGKFYASSRQTHRRTIKGYLFLFGFVSTLVLFSQLYLSLYNYEPDVQGLFG